MKDFKRFENQDSKVSYVNTTMTDINNNIFFRIKLIVTRFLEIKARSKTSVESSRHEIILFSLFLTIPVIKFAKLIILKISNLFQEVYDLKIIGRKMK